MLSGKTVLITGASGAIGFALAQEFEKQNAKLILTGTNPTKLEELQTNFPDAIVLPCNLSSQNDIVQMIQQAKEKSGDSIDILINNAGITKDNLIIRMREEDFMDVLNVNLNAAFLLSKTIVKDMIKKKFGRIINITSIVGHIGNAGQSNYCASKAGLIGFSKALALEVAGRGVSVNCISPGFIKSPMSDKIPEPIKEQLLSKIPMKQIGDPKDIALAALYLANASYVTGETLHVNGGMFMA